MKPRVAALVVVWAVGATIAAGTLAITQEEAPEPPDSPPAVAAEEPPASYSPRAIARLERRIARMREALATVLSSGAAQATTPTGADASEPAEPAPQRLLSLMDELRRLEDGDEWTTDKWLAIAHEQNTLLSSDPATHLALMERLGEATSEDAALDVLSLLTENPFTDFVHDAATIAAIHSRARELLTDARPYVRAAAARVLYAYGDHTREDVLIGLARLADEPDPQVRSDLLAELSVAAKGYALTIEEARPLVDGLRKYSTDPDGGWAAGALAQWTTSEEDLRHVTALLRDAKGDRAQEVLNALDRDTRLAGAHESACRELLVAVIEDGARDELVRGLAAHFLRGYAPWDAATADVARRYDAW